MRKYCDKYLLFLKNVPVMFPCFINKSVNLTLRKKCLHSELFWSVFSRIWTEYGEIRPISPYSVRMPGNTDQNNSEYKHFSRSVNYELKYMIFFSMWSPKNFKKKTIVYNYHGNKIQSNCRKSTASLLDEIQNSFLFHSQDLKQNFYQYLNHQMIKFYRHLSQGIHLKVN